MTQLSVPHFDGLPSTPAWLRPADGETGQVVFVVLRAGQATLSGRLTRLSPDDAHSYRVLRQRTMFSWRSAWLGALSALGLVGGIAAAAEATQPDRPIRIALPPSRPATVVAPLGFVEPAKALGSVPGRSQPSPLADINRSPQPVASLTAATNRKATPQKVAPQSSSSSSGEFFRAEPVQAAARRAILSGIAQFWTYGGLEGVVVAGPLEMRSNQACHRIALWAENQGKSGDSMTFASCLNDRGEWKSPARLRPDPSSDFADDSPPF